LDAVRSIPLAIMTTVIGMHRRFSATVMATAYGRHPTFSGRHEKFVNCFFIFPIITDFSRTLQRSVGPS